MIVCVCLCVFLGVCVFVCVYDGAHGWVPLGSFKMGGEGHRAQTSPFKNRFGQRVSNNSTAVRSTSVIGLGLWGWGL